MSDVGRTYGVTGALNGDGTATLSTKQRSIDVDSSPAQGDQPVR